MLPARARIPFLLQPPFYLYLYFFFLVTCLNQELHFLTRIHFELLLIVASLVTLVLDLWIFRRYTIPNGTQLLLGLCLLLMGMPLLSSIANDHYLTILHNQEYRSWVKMLLAAPVLYIVLGQSGRENFLNVIFMTLATLAIIFIYRFYVLHEVREFDLRPLLHIKNGDPNFLSILFGAPLPIVLYRIFSAESILKRVLYGGLFMLLLGCAVATESRMGVIAVLVGFLTLIRYVPGRLRTTALWVLLGVVLFAAFYDWERFSDFADESNRMRWRSIVTGLSLFSQNPFLGFGWDTASYYFYQVTGYPRLLSETFPLNVHNTPIQLLAELGFFGFAVYISVLMFTFWRVLSQRSPMGKYLMACLVILFLNLLTLPLLTKDFVILFLVMISTLALYEEPEIHTHRV